jgi:hypothetical protein
MKITHDIKSAQAINALLEKTNGRANSHTFNTFGDLEAITLRAEKELDGYGLSKKERVGATVLAVSGNKMPHAYKYQITVNHAEFVRKSSGWVLSSLTKHQQWGGGGQVLTVTEEQAEKMIAKFKQGFRIAK